MACRGTTAHSTLVEYRGGGGETEEMKETVGEREVEGELSMNIECLM